MSKIIFDGAGFKAEQLVVNQFNGRLTNKKEHQYADIDAFIKSKKGTVNAVSVKDQLWSSEKYGSIQIETKLTNSRNGATQDGCFYQCKARDYFWRIWTKEYGDTWLIIRVSKMKEYIKNNKDSLKTWATRPATEEKNRSFNRYFDRSEGFIIPIEDITHLGQLKPVEGGKKH